MNLTFDDADLAALCNSEFRLVRRWGKDGFRAVGRRLLELAAADVSEIKALPGASISSGGDGTVIIGFDDGYVRLHGTFLNGHGGRAHNSPKGLHILRIEIGKGSGAS